MVLVFCNLLTILTSIFGVRWGLPNVPLNQ